MFRVHSSEVRPLIKINSVISLQTPFTEFYIFGILTVLVKKITQLTHEVRPQP